MRRLGKRKTDSSARERTRKLFTSEYTNSCAKKKKENSLYSNEDTIYYNQQCHPLHLGNKQYKQFPQKKRKKKKKECEREREGEGKGEKRERKREREEERLRNRGRESEKKKKDKKEKKEEKEKEEEKIEKAVLKVHRSLQTHSLARS